MASKILSREVPRRWRPSSMGKVPRARRIPLERASEFNDTLRQNKLLGELSWEELAQLVSFESVVIMARDNVPDDSETARMVYAEAPWDMIVRAAKKDGYRSLARHLEERFRSWLSLPRASVEKSTSQSSVDQLVNCEAL